MGRFGIVLVANDYEYTGDKNEDFEVHKISQLNNGIS